MCEFISFLIHKDAGDKTELKVAKIKSGVRVQEIMCGNLRSHSGSHKMLGTSASDWRECEWTKDGAK